MPPTQHAKLGPSSSHRWMNCGASIRLSDQVPTPPTNESAARGTVAHDIVEKVLHNWLWEDGGNRPEHYLDFVYEQDGFEIVVDQTMVDGVDVMVRHVWERWSELASPVPSDDFDGQIMLEAQMTLEPLDPPAPIWGTGDVVIQMGDHLEIIDYKNGYHRVEAVDNPQLLLYALMASVHTGVIPETVRATIVQPNDGSTDPIRSVDYTREDLVAFKHEVFEAAEATLDPMIRPEAGPWCRWCPAMAVCPAKKAEAMELATMEFAAEQPPLPMPQFMSDDQIAEALDIGERVEEWLREVRKYAQRRMEGGDTIPGLKLIEGRSLRRWHDEKQVEIKLKELGYDPADFTKTSLLSPAQVEKLVDDSDIETIDELWYKPEGKPKLVPDRDPRPAMTDVNEDFGNLTLIDGDQV